MSREIYAGVSGASAAWMQLDLVSNNLANMSTTGFKASKIAFQVAKPAGAQGVLAESYVESQDSKPDMSDGPLKKTGAPLDLALQGRGFFSVQAQDGRELLTRSGHFRLDSEGFVENMDGMKLMSSAGPVQVPRGETLQIGEMGQIVGSSSGLLGTLKVVDGDVKQLGQTLWESKGPTVDVLEAQLGGDTKVAVYQGHLEDSNVNPLAAMVELVEASR
ncbi:MAG: flagellar basal-body rod protein FlgF, partial [Kiritimatiellia bacterium]